MIIPARRLRKYIELSENTCNNRQEAYGAGISGKALVIAW
jgi:hypothetical protein